MTLRSNIVCATSQSLHMKCIILMQWSYYLHMYYLHAYTQTKRCTETVLEASLQVKLMCTIP